MTHRAQSSLLAPTLAFAAWFSAVAWMILRIG
jgi:hypothetical protein